MGMFRNLGLMMRRIGRFMSAHTTIRTRMLAVSVLLVLLPAAAIIIFSVTRGLEDGRQQVVNQLESVATLKEAELNTWVRNLQADLGVVLIDRAATSQARTLLSSPADSEDFQAAHASLRAHFVQTVAHVEEFEELFLINSQGRTVLSTNPTREGQYHLGQTYFQLGLKGPYIRPLSYPILADQGFVIVVLPILDEQGDPVGVLASHANTQALNQIMQERTGLGKTGETYLVGRSHLMLTESPSQAERLTSSFYVFSEGINHALEASVNGFGSYTNYRGAGVIGVYHWLPELEVVLLAEQERSEAFRGIYRTLGINLSVAVVAMLAAVGASLYFTRGIAVPLADLADTAVQIASGDLERTVDLERSDEIGSLARAFNSMTAQLRGLIGDLERRVMERTAALQEANQALRRQTLQLETSAQVSREIISILDIDELLARVVELIRERFGYYGVDIYLLEQETRLLVFQAGSRAGSPQRGRLKHLEIEGRGLNSKAIRTNQPVIANDVSQDPLYLIDESMSETRSEAVIPLRSKGTLIGTLDVQSTELGAFPPEDVLVLQSLSDQVAIAIENARLYDRSREMAVHEERARLARELHDSITQSLFSLDLHAKALTAYLHTDVERAEEQMRQIRQITRDTLQEMRSLIFDLRPSLPEEIGLAPALERLVEHFRRPGRPELALSVTSDGQLPSDLEQSLFRIAQEAVHNSVKHAEASRVSVTLAKEAGEFRLRVQDDGKGFEPASCLAAPRGLGLPGMRERARLMGARLEIVSQPGQGTCIEICVPAPGDEV